MSEQEDMITTPAPELNPLDNPELNPLEMAQAIGATDSFQFWLWAFTGVLVVGFCISLYRTIKDTAQ